MKLEPEPDEFKQLEEYMFDTDLDNRLQFEQARFEHNLREIYSEQGLEWILEMLIELEQEAAVEIPATEYSHRYRADKIRTILRQCFGVNLK